MIFFKLSNVVKIKLLRKFLILQYHIFSSHFFVFVTLKENELFFSDLLYMCDFPLIWEFSTYPKKDKNASVCAANIYMDIAVSYILTLYIILASRDEIFGVFNTTVAHICPP